ncbi:MAG TPA: type III pantothenate kinase [Mogibacterium sp.]|nr:type III pantothenate kinase [Mogibacterium sp.]
MLLAIDVGNTNIVFGVFKGREMIDSWRMATDNKRSADEYGVLIDSMFRHDGIDPKDVKDVIISSVVPSLLFTMEHMCLKFFDTNPIVVETGIKTGLKIKYDDPRQVGSDRIANSVAAFTKYRNNLIVIDFGTATTFCCISADGSFIGGAIAPGLKTSAVALFEHTAKLPNVDLEIPGKYICKNTNEGMQSGLIYGHMGFTEHMVAGMKKEMSEELDCKPEDIKVIATGGMATMIESGVDCIDVIDRRLTLDGLQILYEKNKGLNKKRVLQV